MKKRIVLLLLVAMNLNAAHGEIYGQFAPEEVTPLIEAVWNDDESEVMKILQHDNAEKNEISL